MRFRSASREQREADAIPSFEVDHSLLTRAILDGGAAWEDRLLDRHLGDRAVVAAGAGPRNERRPSGEAAANALRTATAGAAIYQGALRAPASFYETYGIDPDLVS